MGTRAFNLARRSDSNTWAKRQAAGDDVFADVPDAVTAFTATANGANAMDLAWTNPAGNAGALLQIERSPTDNTNYAVIDIVDADDEAYADSGLNAETAYFYRATVIRQTAQTATAPEADDTTTA